METILWGFALVFYAIMFGAFGIAFLNWLISLLD